MANLTETSIWESGIYRIETTDPIIGGENGISNIQAKQLGSRTKYLKLRADQVDAAAGSYGSLSGRMDAVEGMAQAVGPEMQSAVAGSALFALDQARQAGLGLRYLRTVLQQEYRVSITNRGVVYGCWVNKSLTATRNISISEGRCFSMGAVWPVQEGVNAASVPSNTGPGAITAYACLYPSGGYGFALGVSPSLAGIPENGFPIYMLTIPAGNTDITDPYLENVVLTDIRRVEPDFPMLLHNPPTVVLGIATLRKNDFRVDYDVMGSTGGYCGNNSIKTVSRAGNGVVLQLCSDADAVALHVRISRLDN
ncbi:MAG: hypothetical protein GX580_02955 [Candidatus Hydrogenedens sp.]|nr:hypothetical protein [Candidatus Hydrogenedens sp.]